MGNEEDRQRALGPRPATMNCGWCRTAFDVQATGRLPSWCSNSCRHRAWEQRHAAASGLVSKEVVRETVEVEVPVEVMREVPVEVTPRDAAWAPALLQLADELDRGLIYERDLPAPRRLPYRPG